MRGQKGNLEKFGGKSVKKNILIDWAHDLVRKRERGSPSPSFFPSPELLNSGEDSSVAFLRHSLSPSSLFFLLGLSPSFSTATCAGPSCSEGTDQVESSFVVAQSPTVGDTWTRAEGRSFIAAEQQLTTTFHGGSGCQQFLLTSSPK